MAYWFKIQDHLIFAFLFLFFVIIAQGIIIFKLVKCKQKMKSGGALDDLISRFRDFWGEFIIYVLATSIVGIFVVSLVKKGNVTLENINNWVSIILGFIALVVSVISLWLSFYNVDQANQSKEAVEKTAKEINARGTERTGWKQDFEKGWYFLDRYGEIVRDEWKKSGDNWYHLGSDDYIEKDVFIFEDLGKVIYYVDANGMMVRNTFVKIDDKYRFFTNNGKAIMDGKIEKDGKRYFFKNGYLDCEEIIDCGEEHEDDDSDGDKALGK